jgi:nitroreductase
MEFADVVRRRRMVRSFTGEPVAPQDIETILDAARRGPSAGYSQGVEFVIVTDPAMRARIALPFGETYSASGHPNFVAQAPVQIVICTSAEVYKSRYRESDKMRVRKEVSDEALWRTPFWYTDAGCAKMLILLAAVDLGLAAAFVGGGVDRLRRLLDIPKSYEPIGIALIGHEAPDARQYGDISADPRPRRPRTEVVHREHW